MRENIDEIRKKTEKIFFVRKNRKFSQLHDALFHFFYDAQFIFYAKLQSCKALNFRLMNRPEQQVSNDPALADLLFRALCSTVDLHAFVFFF